MFRNIAILLFGLLSHSFGWAQLQAIPLHGTVMDSDGFPVAGAEISLTFNQLTFAKTHSGYDGSYQFQQKYYGDVHEVDVELKAEGYKSIVQKNISMDSVALDVVFKAIHRNGIVIYGHSPPIIRCGGGGVAYYRGGGMVRLPWGTFSYYKDGWDEPVIYYNKMCHNIRIVDREAKPVPHANVSIRFQGENTYWGQTDSLGKLNLHIQFATAAREGNVRIEAPGFRVKHKPMETFEASNYTVYRLKRKKR